MPGAYSSYDTLTLEWGEATIPPASAAPLPVLARISHAKTPMPRPDDGPSAGGPTLSVDAAHEAAPPHADIGRLAATVFEIHADAPAAVPVATDQQHSARGPHADDDGEHRSRPAAKPRPSNAIRAEETQSEPKPPRPPIEEPAGWTALLLRVESAVAPYSQVIVLLTLLAAAGLTLLLLRSENAKLESGPPALSPNPTGMGSALASTPAVAPVAAAPVVQHPAPEESIAAATATGPAGLPATTPIEPHREQETADPVRVAQRPLAPPVGAYPEAASLPLDRPAGPTVTPNAPTARISGVKKYQRQTR